jgi:sec-independent protein translocase protein TatA
MMVNFSVFGNLMSPWAWIFMLVIVLIIFGPGKLPDLGKTLGKTFSEFRNASNEVTKTVEPPEQEEQKEPESKKDS